MEDKQVATISFYPLLNSAFNSLSSCPRFIHHHPNQHHYPYYNLNIRTKILLNGVEWPLRAGLRGKNIAEIAQIENAGLRWTSKTLGRDSPRLDIFLLEIPPKQDIALHKTVSSDSAHFWAVLPLRISCRNGDVVAAHRADLETALLVSLVQNACLSRRYHSSPHLYK